MTLSKFMQSGVLKSPFTSQINFNNVNVRTFYFTPKSFKKQQSVTQITQSKSQWSLFNRSYYEEEDRPMVIRRTMYGWKVSILKPLLFVVNHF